MSLPKRYVTRKCHACNGVGGYSGGIYEQGECCTTCFGDGYNEYLQVLKDDEWVYAREGKDYLLRTWVSLQTMILVAIITAYYMGNEQLTIVVTVMFFPMFPLLVAKVILLLFGYPDRGEPTTQ